MADIVPLTPKPLTVTYVPLGEKTEIELTVERTKNFLAVPTRSGKLPTSQDIIKFMMLCKSQELNPWAGDAYLVGYDSKDGPTFTLIAAHQSLLKRAEACPTYEGMESGVVVEGSDKQPHNRAGDYVHEGERLLGGWARVVRSDRKIDSFDSLALKTYNTNRSRWSKDPAGMIAKCAEASALRKAFPTQIGGLYCNEEMEHVHQQTKPEPVSPVAGILSHYGSGVVDGKFEDITEQANPQTVEVVTATPSDELTQGRENMQAMLDTLPEATTEPTGNGEVESEYSGEIAQTEELPALDALVKLINSSEQLNAEQRDRLCIQASERMEVITQ